MKTEELDKLIKNLYDECLDFNNRGNTNSEKIVLYIRDSSPVNYEHLREVTIDFETFSKYIKENFVGQKVNNNCFCKNDKTLEILTIDEFHDRQLSPFLIERHDFSKTIFDKKRGIKYSFSPISPAFLLNIMYDHNIFSNNEIKSNIRRLAASFWHSIVRIKDDEQKILSSNQLLELFFTNNICKKFNYVVKLCNKENMINDTKYKQSLLESYIFNLNLAGYKIKFCSSPSDYLDSRRHINHKSINNEIIKKSPQRIYDKDLLDLYLTACWNDDAFTQYICYYQILEHFFTKIPNDQIVKMVQDELTKPNFIFTNREDILYLIDEITNQRNADKKENTSLKLVITYFIDDLNKLKNKLSSEECDYFAKEIPQFLKGIKETKIKINFNSAGDNISKIAKRIYAIRNSLVHNKESMKNNYDPLRDSKALIKEVPLIKAIAEEAIIESGNFIE